MKKSKQIDGVGVGAVIFDENNRLFLAKRGEKARSERGKWECPGGGLERFESLKEAIEREFKEEFGAEVEFVRVLEVLNHIIPSEDKHWVAIPALCNLKKGTPRILEPEKCAEIGWFTFSEMEKMPLSVLFGDGLMDILKDYLNEKTDRKRNN